MKNKYDLYTPAAELRLSERGDWISDRWSVNVDDKKLPARFRKRVNCCWWWGICSRKFFFESDNRVAIELKVKRRERFVDDGSGDNDDWCSFDEHELFEDAVDSVPIILRFVVLLLY